MKLHLTVTLDHDDMTRFDAYCSTHGFSRGEGIVSLLDESQGGASAEQIVESHATAEKARMEARAALLAAEALVSRRGRRGPEPVDEVIPGQRVFVPGDE